MARRKHIHIRHFDVAQGENFVVVVCRSSFVIRQAGIKAGVKVGVKAVKSPLEFRRNSKNQLFSLSWANLGQKDAPRGLKRPKMRPKSVQRQPT